MPVFRYDTPENRRVGSIADLIQRQGQIQANAAQQVGQAQAQAAAQRGQIWGNTIGSIGQMIGAVPQQLQQQKEQAQVGQMRAMQLESAKQEQAQRQAQMADVAAMDQAYSPQAALGPGGQGPMPQGAQLPDRETILKALPGHLQPIAQKHFAEIDEAKKKDRETRNDFWAALAAGVDAFDNDPSAAMHAIKEAEEDYPQQAQQAADLIRQNPSKEYVGQLTRSLMLKSPKYAEQLRKAEPKTREVTVTNPDGSTTIQIVKDEPGQKFESAPKPPTEAPGGFDAHLRRVAKAKNITVGDMLPQDVLKEKAAFEAAGRAPQQPTDEPVVVVMGPDGKPVYVPRSQAIGKQPATGSLKASSGVEKKALSFFNRAQQADKDLEGLEPTIQAKGIAGQARMKFAPNFAQTQEGQAYGAAQRAFTEARLRKDSGAAIPEGEFENDRITYFVQPGDSQETQEQKRRARSTLLASMAFESGQALGEYVGDPEEAKALVEGYKRRAQKPTETGGKGGGVIYAKDPSGKVHQAPAGTALPAGWLQVEKR
jgi:hypothetical protein